jgi:aldehyde dehydrogenase (NAD+)
VEPMTAALALPPANCFIDNAFVEPQAGQVDVVLNPATEAPLGRVPAADERTVDDAIAAARRAADTWHWSELTPLARSDALYRLAEVLSDDLERILAVVVAETGCPVSTARGHQVALPIEHMHYWAEAARRPDLVGVAPRVTRRVGGAGLLGGWAVRREPYGVVAAITPYNFPLLQAVMKIGPALAAGNTVVLKGSPLTPFSTLLLAEAVQKAGLPDGVVNVVTGGAAAGRQLIGDRRVDVVSFTGSDTVGAVIAGQAAARFAHLVLEMGGKSPLIVCADADLAAAAAVGAKSATFHAGQGCALTTRHLVHRSIRDEYVAMLCEQLGRVSVGDPTDPRTGMGPLIRPSAVERVHQYVTEAAEHGARVVAGGTPGDHDAGFYYQPTVLTDVANCARVAREEIFGPVVVVLDFETDDEAVSIANDSPFGLAGHVMAGDPADAFELACRLRAGSVDINGGPGYTSPGVPFGGYKRSGVGRENGEPGIDEYTQFKTIKYHAG